MDCDVLVIGAGAAGIFGALKAAEGDRKVVVLEAAGRALSKVKISGGGRCNVTHACFDLPQLVQNYPRGGKALSSILSRFMPQDTRLWFESRGVPLKVEKDGRVFPQSDSSQSIIDCLLAEARRLDVQILTSCKVRKLIRAEANFEADTSQGIWNARRLLLAPGGSPGALNWLKELGHHPVEPVPSLFTFTVPDPRLKDLAGVSVPEVRAWLDGQSLSQRGALLVTHWGLSGPVILRLSAWGARCLAERKYRHKLWIDWLPELSQEQVRQTLHQRKQEHPRRLLASDNPWPQLPRRLWSALMGEDRPWGHLQDRVLNRRAEELKRCPWEIAGKGVFKEEFVMAGGVPLNEVDLKTLQSRLCPGLYLAGEILDVDGITGGFNFQNAWATGFIAGQALARS